MTIPLPAPADLSNLTLHSPSRIIGTPFATSSTRFEYPFPDPSSDSPSPSLSASPASSPGSYSSHGSPSIGGISITLNLPLSLPPSAQFHQSIALIGSSVQMTSTGNPSYHSPTHPKLRMKSPPPIPPTLIKKRNRWSMGLLGRRLGKEELHRDDKLLEDASMSSDATSDWTIESDSSSSSRSNS
ncbi:hypothetical protein AMATHDRAFT_1477 [Amanita thiersii Skay4041]|uniref:Uncharacterized protein n=1 Tax=Amanita thiersii Skay4041 TaxID=703135 RepID=A0A2A9NX95_9AGAR|nr:hypothetical protein AMATHDRAFT_1477 [Amanita thiersii Skay4041]